MMNLQREQAVSVDLQCQLDGLRTYREFLRTLLAGVLRKNLVADAPIDWISLVALIVGFVVIFH